MSDTPIDPRALDLRISAPPLGGFIVWEAGQVITAFRWRHELADWLMARLGDIPGEREREARALAASQVPPDNVEPFPKVVSSRTAPERRRGFFGG